MQSISEESVYSNQYKTIIAAGHNRPAQEIGAPTLIWHVAVWPQSGDDPENVPFENPAAAKQEDARITYEKAIQDHNQKRKKIIGEPDSVGSLNDFLRRLQERGRFRRSDFFQISTPLKRDQPTLKLQNVFEFAQPETLSFTLWWGDRVKHRYPGFDSLRVRVQVEAQAEYYALTFLIDISKIWSAGSVYISDLEKHSNILGARRKHLFDRVNRVVSFCEARLKSDELDNEIEKEIVPLENFLPEDLDSDAYLESVLSRSGTGEPIEKAKIQAAQILDDSKYLYSGVWADFCKEFNFSLSDITGQTGRVFANFRGVVLSTSGLSTSELYDRETASPGFRRFRKFGDDFDPEAKTSDEKASSEANAVVKAFWPLIRRMKPYADNREYIACGVMGWRALYITALGSKTDHAEGDESAHRRYEDPVGNLPEWDASGKNIWSTHEDDDQIGSRGEEPVRYLLLTKHAPHRGQLGRIVDRINALGTTRLFALKNLSAIYEASGHIRLRGQQLDEITKRWLAEKEKINKKYPDSKNEEAWDRRNEELSKLNSNIELELLNLGSSLNNLGQGVTGGLFYRISRSKFYAKCFNDLRVSLIVGNIESWTSYDQFARRGLQPVFDFIESVGPRLSGLRGRVADVMDSIQTAALVAQTEETRENTRELEKLQKAAANIGILGAVGIFFASIEPINAISEHLFKDCFELGKAPSTLRCTLLAEVFGPGGENSAFWSLLACDFVILFLIGISLAWKERRLALFWKWTAVIASALSLFAYLRPQIGSVTPTLDRIIDMATPALIALSISSVFFYIVAYKREKRARR